MHANSLPPARPWYREPWPWLLMAGPFIVIVAGIITTIYAVQSFDGLVADDYYKRGLTVNQEITRVTTAVRWQVNAQVRYEPAKGRIVAEVNATQSLPPVLTLRLAHPTRAAEDRRVVLQQTDPGIWSGPVANLPVMRWKAHLETPDWTLTGNWDRPGRDPLRLAPRGPAGG